MSEPAWRRRGVVALLCAPFLAAQARAAAPDAAVSLVAINPAATGSPVAVVSIDNFTFAPASLTIPVGTRVVFTNRDDIPHTVTSAAQPPAFRSPPLDTDDAFAFVFVTAGTYSYFCSLHPHMQGTVIAT